MSLGSRLVGMIARGVVTFVDDLTTAQRAQLLVQGEPTTLLEVFSQYGFSSIPLVGAEAVVAFLGGARDHGIVIGTDDKRTRPKAGEAGQVTVWHYAGHAIKLLLTKIQIVAPLVEVGTGAQLKVVRHGDTVSVTVPIDAFGPGIPPAPVVLLGTVSASSVKVSAA